MKKLAVIGAGLAGLAAAQVLVKRGFAVVVYEKSGSVGGRAMTCRVGDCVIDHGAQVVQAPSADLQRLVLESTPDAQAIQGPVWTFDAAGTISEGDPVLNTEPAWCWPDGVNTLAKVLAANIDIHLNMGVHRLATTADGYTLYDDTGHALDTANAVLLNPPAPQAAEIIAASHLDQELQKRLLRELTSITYRRCLSVALAYAVRPAVPWYALVNTDRQHPIAWLACEHAKPGHVPDGVGVLIAQMSPDFSVSHWDTVEKGTYGWQGQQFPMCILQIHEYVQALLDMSLGLPLWSDAQRWRYALPDHGSSASFDMLNQTGSGLYFAGDYIDGRGRVYEVIECGWRVAELIAS